MKEILVDKNEAGQRLDKLLIKLLNQAPSSFIYKMLRKKNIKLNQKKADGKEILKSGDTVQIFLSDETYDKFHSGIAHKSVHLPVVNFLDMIRSMLIYYLNG